MHLAPLSLALAALVAANPEPVSQCPLPERPRIVQMLMLIDRSGSLTQQKDLLRRAVKQLAEKGEFEKASQGCKLYYAVGGFFSEPVREPDASVEACDSTTLIHWVPGDVLPSWIPFDAKAKPSLPEAVRQAANERLEVRSKNGFRIVDPMKTDTPLLPLLEWADIHFNKAGENPETQETERARLLLLASDTMAECHIRGQRDFDSQKKPVAKTQKKVDDLAKRFLTRWSEKTKNYQQVYVLKFKSDEGREPHLEDELYPSLQIGKGGIHGYEFDEKIENAQVAQIANDIKQALKAACQATIPECCGNHLDDNGDGQVDEGCCLHGESQEEGFPEVVAVGKGRGVHCSGAVVDERAVLTARHCLPADTVLLGESLNGEVRRRHVRGVLVPSDDKLDVALLELDAPVLVSPRQRRDSQDDSPPASMLTHVGFGAQDSAGAYGFGVKHQLLLDSQGWGCTREQALRLGCDPDNEMFVPGSPGRDTCRGDSGGPLYERSLYEPVCRDGPDPTQYRTQWRLVGITSRSAEGGRVACGEGGIYVRADRIAPWLEAALNEIQRRTAPGREIGP